MSFIENKKIVLRYIKYLLFFCVLVVFHILISRILIFNYSEICTEGGVIETIQLCVLGLCVILNFLYIKNGKLLFLFFLLFIFFEEINWGYDYFPESIKRGFLSSLTKFGEGNLSFHNMFQHKVEDLFSAILTLFLIFPHILRYIIPFAKINKIISVISDRIRIYVASIVMVYNINASYKIIKSNKLYEHANEEYFELMLYIMFFLVVFNIACKKIKMRFSKTTGYVEDVTKG